MVGLLKGKETDRNYQDNEQVIKDSSTNILWVIIPEYLFRVIVLTKIE